jgi:hypothetical protein
MMSESTMDKLHLPVGTRVLVWDRAMIQQRIGFIQSQEDATHYLVGIPLGEGNHDVVQRHIRYISEAPPEHAPIRGPLTDAQIADARETLGYRIEEDDRDGQIASMTAFAELERLREWERRSRPLIEAMADVGGSGVQHCTHPFDMDDRCRVNERWSRLFPDKWAHHGPNCLVSQARALLDDDAVMQE